MLDAFTTEEISKRRTATGGCRPIVMAAALSGSAAAAVRVPADPPGNPGLTESIHSSIYSLEGTVRRIAEGNFGDRVKGMNVEELRELGEQINQMADRLETLIEQIRQNQEHLSKAELRTLQAQINPHFLYNTLDTIVWQAESGKGEEVVRLTRNLSDFFRISLSSGADWIPVSQELKHVSAYLSIQKTRYRDILDYEVDQPEDLEEVYMLKLLLQPLVENALYHGIKNKRGGGKIGCRCSDAEPDDDLYRDGYRQGHDAGTAEGTGKLLKEEPPTARPALEPGHSGFGMRNVDMRIRLYYGKQTGLLITSGQEGTEVSFSIPIRTREEIDHDESLSRG